VLTTQYISYVSRSNLFTSNSQFFGFNSDKLSPFAQDLFDLLNKWEMDGYVEIYDDDTERKWGRVKSSGLDGKGRPVAAYIHLYHGRVQDDSSATTPEEKAKLQDPLVVITFQMDSQSTSTYPAVVAEFVINHDQYFGRLDAGKNEKNLARLRAGVGSRIDLAKGKFKKI